MDTLEDTIAQAKAQKAKANAADAKETLAAELGYESADDMIAKSSNEGKTEDSAFSKTAVGISDAQHTTNDENIQQTHSNIKEKLLSPVIELSMIQEACRKENEAFKRFRTVDDLTQKENDIIEKEVSEVHTDILRLLVSLEARGRDDANRNLEALVSGEQARLSAQALGLNPPVQSPSWWKKLTNKIGGK